MAVIYPSGREATDLTGILTARLVASAVPVNHIAALDTWLRAKEAQRLEDGTSARIEPNRFARMCRRAGMAPSVRQVEITVAEAVERAIPAIRAAVDRHKRGAKA